MVSTVHCFCKYTCLKLDQICAICNINFNKCTISVIRCFHLLSTNPTNFYGTHFYLSGSAIYVMNNILRWATLFVCVLSEERFSSQ